MVAELQLTRLENQDEPATAKSGLFDTTRKHIPSCSPLSELQNTIQVMDFSETIAELLVARIYVSDDDQLINKRRVSANSEETHHPSNSVQDPAKEYDTLESHPKLEHIIIKFIQPSCSSNVNKEVCLASNLSIFRFGHNFIVDATISKILITNLERPMKKDNLLVSNTIITKHISQHIVSLRETDSDLLLQQKLFPLFHLKFIYIWIALLVSYLAYIWSQVRHICYNSFDFRNIKPRFEFSEKTDANIISYSKSSEIECETQCIAEWGGAKSEPFVCLLPKPFSHKDRLQNKNITFNSNMRDQIFDLLLKNDYIRILDHHVKPSIQGRMFVSYMIRSSIILRTAICFVK